ncbi:MAG TPA: PhzF family phenazine biosynthesis protein [Candidatus Sulfotelmatobacter sp.]|nr:PhzF family phenazine biosynthesis protein [Candidatus Sulfotelmatobacter sp.]
MRIPLFHVDAFTKQPFRGNPAAVCLLDLWLDDSLLRRVAAENNLSATAFMVTGKNGYELRWFSPRCEVKLCGHATLAAAHALINVRNNPPDCAAFRTRFHGILTVTKSGEFLVMDFPAILPMPFENVPANLISALRVDSQSAQILEANNTYIVVFDSQDVIENLRPNFAMLEDLHPFVVAVTAPGTDADFVSRYFAPSYGIPEDPVTGSAHCLLTPYWAGRFGKTKLHARQLSERGGVLWCELKGDRVLLTGKAVVTMEGFLSI